MSIGCAGGYRGRPTPLLDRMYVAPSLDARDTLLYEAQIATQIFLFDDLVENEVELRTESQPMRRLARRFLVAPTFRIRQLQDSSAAVRTPSFIPSVRYELHWLRGDTIARVPGSVRRDLGAIRDVGVRFEWTHHSNGQAGCFRAGFVPPPTGDPDDCIPASGTDTGRLELNRANGDFSTTYWGVTPFFRHIALTRDQDELWVFEVSLGYQLHRFGLFGDMRDEQRRLFGTHRARLDLNARRNWGAIQGRVDGQLEIAERTDARIEPWRGHVDLTVRSSRLLGAGLFLRYLDGQDYYNIGFAQRRQRVLLGFVLDPSRPESPG
jgi:hypothetical protein